MKVSFHFRTNTEEIELMKVPTSFTYNAYLSVQIFFRVTVSEVFPIRCLSLGIIAINFFHAEIVFTLPFRTMTVKLRSAAGNKFSGCFLNEKI